MEKNGTLASPATRGPAMSCRFPEAHKQYALGMRPPTFELLRLAQVSISPSALPWPHPRRHILEGDLLLLHEKQARAALAERQRLVAAGLHRRSMKNQMAPSRTKGPTLNRSGSRILFCGSLMEKLILAASIAFSKIFVVAGNRGVELILGRALQVSAQLVCPGCWHP